MWSNSMLKERAKRILSNSYWMAFVVCLVGGIITGGMNIGYRFSGNNNIFKPNNTINNFQGDFNSFFQNPLVISTILGIIGFIAVIGFTIGLVYTLFVVKPVLVGKARFFLSNRKGNTDFVNLFYAFKNGKYLNIVKAMAWRYLFTFLWTLLFIIPGIVKAYAYSMTPYILADNPDIGYDRALKLSMEMTNGYKADIFVLQLSFIGWYLLGILCCGIGVIFVNPYYEAAMAEMYGQLRKNAIVKGICNPNELNLTEADSIADNLQ